MENIILQAWKTTKRIASKANLFVWFFIDNAPSSLSIVMEDKANKTFSTIKCFLLSRSDYSFNRFFFLNRLLVFSCESTDSQHDDKVKGNGDDSYINILNEMWCLW